MSRYLIRQTAAGSEFWDNVEKRTVSVPFGETPDFEYIEDSDSLLDTKEDETVEVSDNLVNDEMSIKSLKAYAEENDIKIPDDKTKKKDIIDFINSRPSES